MHQKIQNHRDEFLHQVSRKLVDSADLIVFENLNISGMLKNHHLAKHIQDHAWGKLIQFTQSKAAKAGKIVELVDARYTSQKCSQCGIIVPKTLAERVHLCPNCGLEMDRDINASLNIVTLGLRGRAYRDTRALVCEAGSPAPLGAGRKSPDSLAGALPAPLKISVYVIPHSLHIIILWQSIHQLLQIAPFEHACDGDGIVEVEGPAQIHKPHVV